MCNTHARSQNLPSALLSFMCCLADPPSGCMSVCLFVCVCVCVCVCESVSLVDTSTW